MINSNPNDGASAAECKICAGVSQLFGETILLRKYRVRYFRCDECGFIQTEAPYWLDEAYSSAIAAQDVGIMQRNLINQAITSAVLNLLFPRVSRCIDFGGGHGVFVRLMRDKGFNFFWSDRHARNDYAHGFESEVGTRFDFLTAFEVLEHLVEPISELSTLMEASDNVLVTTCLVPTPAPKLPDWWYYVPTSGQHVSFYTERSLDLLGAHFGRSVVSFGPYHLFSKRPVNRLKFRLASHFRSAQLINLLFRRPSLTDQDFRQMTK